MEPKAVTAEELMHIEGHCDLLRGRVRTMTPPGADHGWSSGRVCRLVGDWVDPRTLGRVYVDAGFLLERDPDTVLAPDVAFVSKERLHLHPKRGYFPGPPDLAAEIRSPGDSRREVHEKAEAWIAHGCRLVLVVDARDATVTVHRPSVSPRTYRKGATLDLGDVIAGLTVKVADLLE